MNFDDFASNDRIRNTWIYEHSMVAYVRRSIRLVDVKFPMKSIPCLDIGSVGVDDDHQGIGIFTGFLERFETAAKKLNRAVYVENILTPRFVKFFVKRGYKFVPGSCETSPNMFKIVA